MKLAVCLLLVAFCQLSKSNVNANIENSNKLSNTKNIYDEFESLTNWSVEFGANSSTLVLAMMKTEIVPMTISFIDPAWGDEFEFHVLAIDSQIVQVSKVITSQDVAKDTYTWSGNISISSLFLGHTPVYVELRRPHALPEKSVESLNVVVTRYQGKIDNIFKIVMGCFVLVLYINFGAVLDLSVLKQILLRPVGPAIGFVGQFLFMPLLSFFIGYCLFRDDIELRLGLFFTGSTPGGGMSNIFTVVLNGNLNLSITMTAISNLAAFGMMPLWIFTLGALIFQDGNFAVPYMLIATMSVTLVVPLLIGLTLQRYFPGIGMKMARVLKPVAIVLAIAMMIFGFFVNSHMFKLFNWKIIVAGSSLPWAGYILGWLLAIACRQSAKDAITIAIETGIQNTGIAMFMLNFTLPQPQADMTSVVPLSNAIFTPLPLLIIYLIRRIFCQSSTDAGEKSSSKEIKQFEEEKMLGKNKLDVEGHMTKI